MLSILFYYTLSSIILGGQNDMDLDAGMRISQHTIKNLHADCDPADNSQFCDLLGKLKLQHIVSASSQVVNGKIYEFELLTNLGKLYMKIWLQTAPAKYILRKFQLEDDEYVTRPFEIKSPETYFE